MGYQVLDSDGNIIGYVETDAEALALMESVPDDIYVFFVGGSTPVVDQFMLQLNGGLGVTPTFFDMLSAKYGKIPETINPFDEIKDEFFKNNTFFIKIRSDLMDSRLTSQLMNVLNRTIPAGSGFFVIIQKREIEEGFEFASSGETVEVFYAPADEPNDGQTGFGETIINAPVL